MERLTLPADARSAKAGRGFVAGFCLRHAVPTDTTDDAVLITSELLGNVYLHVTGVADIGVGYGDGVLRVEVGDGSRTVPVSGLPSEDATGGRGVRIMDALAASWGASLHPDGKTVWFELHD